MNSFKKNQEIVLKNGEIVIVNKLLGQGGQGAVYEVTKGGKKYALKWYLPEYLRRIDQKKFYDNLCANQQAGSPSNNFLWMKSVSEYKQDAFGYLMDLRPNRFCSFTSILNAEKKITSLKIQLLAAKNICKAFQSLHKNGYGYQDINDGNFFVDIKTGEVLVCDNDNVAPCGVWMGMAGKDRYMAPEVVLGQKHAGMESDLFSLAVVLYMLFFISHPLEGKAVHECPCLTTQFMKKFYAEKPVFVFDPNNNTNRPVRGVDNNIITRWPCYPDELKNLFIKSFTKGLRDASYRVRENEWIDCFDKLLDSIVVCPMCGGEQFYKQNNDDKQTFICEDCKQSIRKPFIWKNKNVNKAIIKGSEIEQRHLLDNDSCSIIGRVVESTKHPGLWGIVNLTNKLWDVEFSNGKVMQIKKDGITPLFKDTTIKIENYEIIIAI